MDTADKKYPRLTLSQRGILQNATSGRIALSDKDRREAFGLVRMGFLEYINTNIWRDSLENKRVNIIVDIFYITDKGYGWLKQNSVQ